MSTSRSTTSTLTYTLKKYSRSYPNTGAGSSSQAPSGSEWQHFTNPVLRLSLDITKSAPSGILEAVKLRIVWIMNNGGDSMDVDQSEVVLENLDLYAFSSMTGAHRMSSPPLKAVFRDSVVGIRYLHSRSGGLGSGQAFRRFQVNFLDPTSASQFIDSIRAVCPCQSQDGANGPSLARNATAAVQPGREAAPSPSTSFTKPVNPSLTRASTTFASNTSNTAPQPYSLVPVGPSVMDIHSSDTFIQSSSLNFTTSSSRPASAASMQSTQRPDARLQHMASHLSDPPLESSLPPSSIPPASLMPPPPPPLTRTHSAQPTSSAAEPSYAYEPDSLRSSILSALQKDRNLYDMSRAELEVLVGQVVREPGFEQLVQTLGTIWDAKGFCAQSSA
ncbi:hypothetical protein PENSPDRAFT_675901 [Peniophora sp. CONT]|nr:hypothetical protein PENSPDRAFT_675901 [Peniophora sp. CONT]